MSNPNAPMQRLKKKHQFKRARLRKTLEAKGIPEAEILRASERMRLDQQAERDIMRTWLDTPRAELDDTGYRPTSPDPLTTGVARATGETAAAVRRGRTITKHQHESRTTS